MFFLYLFCIFRSLYTSRVILCVFFALLIHSLIYQKKRVLESLREETTIQPVLAYLSLVKHVKGVYYFPHGLWGFFNFLKNYSIPNPTKCPINGELGPLPNHPTPSTVPKTSGSNDHQICHTTSGKPMQTH